MKSWRIIEDLGKHIREVREQNNVGLNELARLTDIDNSNLSKYERGVVPIKISVANKLLKPFHRKASIAYKITHYQRSKNGS
jgi:transcriptional regulator with XRE-family HTH domain